MNRYYSQKVTTAETPAGFRLRVTFADGFSAELDLATLPDAGPAFAPLHDPVFFAKAKVNHEGAVEWPEKIELSPATLRVWCEAGHILNGEETDEWINKNDPPPGGGGNPAVA